MCSFFKSRKAIFFTVDALLASSLILIGLLAAYSLYSRQITPDNIWYSSSSIMESLSSIKAGQLNISYISYLVSSGAIKNSSLNDSAVELIGELWATGKADEARELSQELIDSSLSGELSGMGAAIYVNGQEIYSQNSFLSSEENSSYLSSSFRLVSGIKEATPKEGYSSRAILSAISSKIQPSYAYFGGLVGQGNITQFMMLPQTYTNISSAYLEMDVPANFTFKINGNNSGTYPAGCSGGGFMRAYQCSINSSYLGNFRPGLNTIEFIFSNYSSAYLSGGFLRVITSTSDLNYSDVSYDPYSNTASKTEYLPGISYVVNLYSSVYAPGNITNLEIFLNYTTDLPLFVNLAGVPVYYSEAEGRIAVTIDNATLASMLNYSAISDKTLPLKIGHYALNNTGNISGGNADVAIITDISASMKGRIGDNDSNGDARTCDQADYFTNPHVRRLNVAVCLNEIFINTIMNLSGNRIWLVTFNDAAVYYYNQSSGVLIEYVNNKNYYPWNNPSGNTCTCCALNRAYGILSQNSNSSRKKYVILMTDGIPNECCGLNSTGGCNQSGLSNSSQYKPSTCDEDYVSDCAGNDCTGPMQSAINAAARIGSINRSSIYSIGLGPMGSCTNANYTMTQIAEKGNGTFFGSTNVTQLTQFVQQLANEIVNQSLVYQYQIVVISGVNSTLSPNSYVKLNYTPSSPPFIFGKIPITLESQSFGNYITSGILQIPEGVAVSDAKVTSYSGVYWTHNLTVNSVRVFNLSDFGSNYQSLGDPFLVSIPINQINSGNNSILISTGTSSTSDFGGSPDDRVIYTLLMNNSVSYSAVDSNALGCNWTLEFNDGTNTTIKVPSDYSGTKSCSFRTASYDHSDSTDLAVYSMLSQLDLNKDGLLDVNINQQSLSIETFAVGGVPSMWGPAKVEARVWK